VFSVHGERPTAMGLNLSAPRNRQQGLGSSSLSEKVWRSGPCLRGVN